jgi:hypothetical protein
MMNKGRNPSAGFRMSRFSILRRGSRILHRDRISNAMVLGSEQAFADARFFQIV